MKKIFTRVVIGLLAIAMLLPPVSIASAEEAPAFVDELENMSNIYDRKDKLFIESGNPQRFGGDASRLVRSTTEPRYITYKTDFDVHSIVVPAYYHLGTPVVDLQFLVSTDDETYTPIVPNVYTSGEITSSWLLHVHESFDLPPGIRYVKIQIEGEVTAWTPQLAKVILNKGTASVEASIPSGSELIGTQPLTLTSQTPGANIYYREVGEEQYQAYTAPIVLDKTVTMETYAVKPGLLQSYPVTLEYTVNQGLVDELDNFSNLFDRSNQLKIEKGNPQRFGGDDSRATRNVKDSQYMIYYTDYDVQSFVVPIYYQMQQSKIEPKFFISSDNVTYTPVDADVYTSGETKEQWLLHVYENMNLPPGVRYVKIELEGDTAWSPQVSRVILNHGTASVQPSLPNGTVIDGQELLTLTTETPGADIFYKMNDDEDFQLYTEPIELTGMATLETYAAKAGFEQSYPITLQYLNQGEWQIDRYGQVIAVDFPGKVTDDQQLQDDVLLDQAYYNSLPPPNDRDDYGGLAGSGQQYGLQATGFFEIQQIGDRKVLTTPEGNVFFSLGVNVIDEHMAATKVAGRGEIFEWIPYNEPEFSTAFYNGQENFSHLLANRIRKTGQPFNAHQFFEEGMNRVRKWGFNTAGAWSGHDPITHQMPNVQMLPISGMKSWSDVEGLHYFDIFVEDAEQKMDAALAATSVPANSTDPSIIGYFIDNEIHFHRIASVIPAKKASEVASKGVLVDLIKDNHNNDITSFNAAWGASFNSFDELYEAELKANTPQAMDDIYDFIELYVEELYSTFERVFRKHDPNHLLLGDRWLNQAVRDDNRMRTILANAAGKYFDVISYNYYTPNPDSALLEDIYELADQTPLMITEFNYGTPERGLNGGVFTVNDQNARELRYRNYVEQAASLGYVVGMHWFSYADQPATGRYFEGFTGERFNTGLIDVTDRPYKDFLDGVKLTNDTIYEVVLDVREPFSYEFNDIPAGAGNNQLYLPRTDEPIVIDGVRDEAYGAEPAAVLDSDDLSVGVGGETIQARFDFLWDEAKLYMFVDVTDPTPMKNDYRDSYVWRGDGVELFVGPDQLNIMERMLVNDRQIILSAALEDGEPYWRWYNTNLQPEIEMAVSAYPDGDGYALEAAIPWEHLNVTPEAGRDMRFDFGLDDSVDGAVRARQWLWNGIDGNANNRGLWGMATLVDGTEAAGLVDELENFDQIFHRTANLFIQSGNAHRFGGDDKRLVRNQPISRYIVYKTDYDMHSFTVPTYFNMGQEVVDLTFFVSADNVTYEQVDADVYTSGVKTEQWQLHVYENFELPAGTRYLKIVMDGEDVAWTPALSRVIINKAVGSVQASIPSGAMIEGSDKLILTTKTPGASIFYKTEDDDEYQQYTGPIELTRTVTIEAYAEKDGLEKSYPVKLEYSVQGRSQGYELIDELENWDHIVDRTNSLFIARNNPERYGEDAARIVRNSTAPGYIVYETDGDVHSIVVPVYYQMQQPVEDLKILVSTDNVTYNPVDTNVYTSGGRKDQWQLQVFESFDLPPGVRYVKIQIEGEAQSWTPQLSRVILNKGTASVQPSIADGSALDGPTLLTLTTGTDGAVIYYKLQDDEEFQPYTGPIELATTTTIETYAEKDGLLSSYPITLRYYNKDDWVIDRFGQVIAADYPGKVTDEQELRDDAVSDAAYYASLQEPDDRDTFGGLEGSGQQYGLQATGFFDVQQIGDRIVLTTPEGNVFFSVGVNVIDENQTSTRYAGREEMFEWIPPTNGEFSTAHYGGNGNFSYLLANRIRKTGEPFDPDQFFEEGMERVLKWGFNTAGAWSGRNPIEHQMPNVQMLPLGEMMSWAEVEGIHYFDIFAEDAEQKMDAALANSIVPVYKDDPSIIGYFIDNEIHFHRIRTEIPAKKASEVASKRVLVDMLKEKYDEDLTAFNTAWGTSFNSFDALYEAPLQTGTAESLDDIYEFIALYVDTLYSTFERVFRKHDPNHLLLGDRLLNAVVKHDRLRPIVVTAASEYFDVISYNYYSKSIDPTLLDEVHSLAGTTPLMFTEFNFGTAKQGLNGGVIAVADEEERVLRYRNYVEQAAALDYVVGMHWFSYTDQPATGRYWEGYVGERYNTGLIDVTDRPYKEFLEGVKLTNDGIYDVVLGLKEPFNHEFDDGQTGAGNNTLDIDYTAHPMQIDGVLDEHYNQAHSSVLTQENLIVGIGGEGMQATYYFAWDETHLYVHAEVMDPTPMLNGYRDANVWRGDGVELFIGPDQINLLDGLLVNDRQLILSAQVTDGLPFHRWYNTILQPEVEMVVIGHPGGDGYSLEAAIPWDAIGGVQPEAGKQMRFDFGLDDSEDGVRRIRQWMWNGIDGNANNRGLWGIATLVDGTVPDPGEEEPKDPSEPTEPTEPTDQPPVDSTPTAPSENTANPQGSSEEDSFVESEISTESESVIRLGERVRITIPAGASDHDWQLTIEELADVQDIVTDELALLSPVFEMLKSFTGSFRQPVVLEFRFDPDRLGEGQKPSIFYYDEELKQWIEIGGEVNPEAPDRVYASVDHFTKFAVFAVTAGAEDAATDIVLELEDIRGHWAERWIEEAVAKGLVNGYPDSSFRPDQDVTRAEFIMMLMRAMGFDEEAPIESIFTDQENIGPWARGAVAQAVQAGIISGYEDGSFRPQQGVIRAEAAVMIARAANLPVLEDAVTGFSDDEEIPAWAKGYVAAAEASRLLEGRGDDRFVPADTITRAEAAVILIRLLEG